MAHHPSMNNVRVNRQIVVQGKKQKVMGTHNRVRSSARLASSTKKRKNKQTGGKTETKAVRRNLFSGSPRKKLERRQSVAIMESSRRTPRKSPRKKITGTPRKHHGTPRKQHGTPRKHGCTPRKTPSKGFRTPGKSSSGHRVLKTKTVTETPAHKQKQNVVLRRLEKERQHARTVSEVKVIAESPEKAVSQATQIRTSPRKHVALKRRSSFYTSGADKKSSRNVQKYQQLEARLTQQLLKSPEAVPVTKLTPSRRIKPMFLFAKCISPSPRHKRSLTFGEESREPGLQWGGAVSPDNANHSLGSRRGPTLGTETDSPSKNTRSQTGLATNSNSGLLNKIKRQVLVSPPEKSKGTIPQSAVPDSPVAQAKIQVPDSPCFNTRSRMQASPSVQLLSPAKRAVRDLNFDSPSKNTRSHDKPISASKRSLFMSPVKNTESNEQITPKKCGIIAGDSLPAFNRSSNIHLVKNQLFSPVKASPLVKGEKIQPRSLKKSPTSVLPADRQGLFSPRRSTRIVDKNSPENVGIPPMGNSDVLFSPRRSVRISNKESPENKLVLSTPNKNESQRMFKFTPPSAKRGKRKSVERTPPNQGKKISPATSPFDSWPRRKARGNITPSSVCKNIMTESSSKTLNSDSDSLEVIETEVLKRKVSNKKRSGYLLSDKENSAVASPQVKRKHSPESAVSSSLLGTPSKRRKTQDSDITDTCSSMSRSTLARCSSLGVTTESSQDMQYFTNNEVFLSNSEETQPFSVEFEKKLTTDSNVTYDTDSVDSTVFFTLQRDRKASLRTFSNQSIESDMESTSSPVFTSPYSSNTSSKKGENSPTSNKANHGTPTNLRKNLSPGTKYSPHISSKSLFGLMNSPLLSDSSEVSGPTVRHRKYSPNVGAKSMMQLIQSPVLCEDDTSRSKQQGHSKSPKSRRSLYRTQTVNK